ncbi:hypothetical protein L1049_024556 [Liquidambar formosana]|uniref:RPW8 domain-containing protein n=1 Tax=Liquidambar formosana TaxID=63359 RepID=A0AAP0S262_LIQFO
MAGSLVGEAALGAVFGELLRAVLDTKSNADGFESDFKQPRINTKVHAISPIIEEIQTLKKQLNRPEELQDLIEHLNKGKELVHKCSKVNCCNSYKRAPYAKKRRELDVYISRFFHINMQALQTRDNNEILMAAKVIDKKIDRIMLEEQNGGLNNQIGVSGSRAAATKPLAPTVELEAPVPPKSGLNNQIGLSSSHGLPEPLASKVGLEAPAPPRGGLNNQIGESGSHRVPEPQASKVGLEAPRPPKGGLNNQTGVSASRGGPEPPAHTVGLDAIGAAKRQLSSVQDLNRLRSTLESISPTIEEIQALKKELDHPKEELQDLIEQLKKGKLLVGKCEKINWLNSYKRPHYATKLRELDDYIRRFFGLNMQAQQTRDGLQVLVTVKSINAKVDRLLLGEQKGGSYNPIGLLGSCGVPEPPALTVGLDLPLKELKMWLFSDGPQVLVLSAPGGCGKTTLAKKLCQDKEVKGIVFCVFVFY